MINSVFYQFREKYTNRLLGKAKCTPEYQNQTPYASKLKHLMLVTGLTNATNQSDSAVFALLLKDIVWYPAPPFVVG